MTRFGHCLSFGEFIHHQFFFLQYLCGTGGKYSIQGRFSNVWQLFECCCCNLWLAAFQSSMRDTIKPKRDAGSKIYNGIM